MTTTIIARTTTAPAGLAPEYWCGSCQGWHTGPCSAAAHHQLGALLTRMVRAADARIPEGRRARRTLQEMVPGYERQPVLTLHRPVMADDACGLCGWWRCRCGGQTLRASRVGPAVASGDGQCSCCGGRFPGWPGGVCDACRAAGRG